MEKKVPLVTFHSIRRLMLIIEANGLMLVEENKK